MLPSALMDIPGGRPVAENEGVWPLTGSAGLSPNAGAVPPAPLRAPGLRSGSRAGLSWSRSVAPVVLMPATVPELVYCQKDQSDQPTGRAGLAAVVKLATHMGICPKAVLLPVQVFHQSAVV